MTSLFLQRSVKFNILLQNFKSRRIPIPLNHSKILPELVTQHSNAHYFHTSQIILKKQSTNKNSTKKRTIDDLIDELDDDDDEDKDDSDAAPINNQHSRDTELSRLLSQKSKGKKPAKGSSNMTYEEFVSIVDGEALWQELDDQLDNLKRIYLHQLSVRSATSIDGILVNFEGDSYPLNEIASISKKDPKKVIIDASAFPQAAVDIMKALRESGMNLNPQQDGLTIYVPIPKVTKEFREKLVNGAKKKLTDSKESLRKVQNKYTKSVSEDELSGKISKDDSRSANECIKIVTNHFMSLGDQLYAAKSKEVMGK